MKRPIFIVGANRSGTTLLRLILNAHPRIAIPDELIYFDSSLAGIPIERWRRPGLSAEAYEDFVNHFLTTHCEPLDELDKPELKEDILAADPSFRRPYRRVLEAWARHYGKERWGEKTPGNLFYADVILEMFPEAQFLYMVRDPRAGVASMQRVSFFSDDVVFNALSRRKHDTTGRSLLERHVPSSQRKTIRYEDLVRRPEAVTQSICRFLSEDFAPEMLHFHRDADEYMKDAAEQRYNETATHPITDDRVDAWRNRLTADQIAVVESLCAPIMRSHGYTPAAPFLPVPRRLEMLIKRAYWSYQCWRHRDVRQYTVKYPIFARTRSTLASLRDRMRRGLRWASPLHSS
jgi:hypothetical protein